MLPLTVPPRSRQQTPSVLTAVAGEDVILPCDVIGDPSPVVRWRKNHAVIDLFSSRHKYFVDDTGSLVIPAADSGDSARYLCVAENVAGVLTQEIRLTVYGQKQMYCVFMFASMLKLRREDYHI